MDKRNPSFTQELDLVNPKAVDVSSENELPERDQSKITKKQKILLVLIVTLSLCIIIGIVPLVLYLTRHNKIDVDQYRETQYDLLVNPSITITNGQKFSSTHDSFHVTLFALDMEGEKYRFLVTNASMETKHFNSINTSLKSDYFIYLELESSSGKILMSKYKKELFEEGTITLLTGVTQVFTVDQDSDYEYSSNCKKKYNNGYECSQNSKKKVGTYTLYEKYESSDNDASENDALYENRATTWVNEKGKVEKCEIKGWYSKLLDSDKPDEKMNFNVSATVEIANSFKLDKSEISKLNEIVKDLPEVELKRDYNMTTYDENSEENSDENNEDNSDDEDDEDDESDEGDEEGDEDYGDDLPQDIITDNSTQIIGDKRRLFSETINSDYFSFYSVPFNLKSYVYSGYDKNYRTWFCGIHRFNFGGLEVKLIKKDFCISSDGTSEAKRKKIKKWAYKKSLKKYIASTSFSVFTFSLYGKVKVKNTPYLEAYLNIYNNIVTNVEIVCKLSVSVTGEANAGIAKGGITFKNTMISYIENYMIGYNSPFSAYISLDKSLEASFEIWIKYLTLGFECFDIFGIEICLPTIEYSKKKTLYDEDYGYAYYAEEFILIIDSFS